MLVSILPILLFGSSSPVLAQKVAQNKTLYIYHDSDYSSHTQSAMAMKMGFQTAMDEVGNKVQGYTLKLLEKDHRGNSVRSKLHMKQFLADPQALFMLGGLHSPPYIRFREYINTEGVLLMVPWAAGGPITRFDKGLNWVFRLSIDDTKAGYRIGQFALDGLNCKRPHLLLEDTPWGKSNQNTMNKALLTQLEGEPPVTWFNWNTRPNAARIILRDVVETGADCILFVGNTLEGENFSKAMISFEEQKRLPIISHWGITGGGFHEQVDKVMREKLTLYFIQTCFSFFSSEPSEHTRDVLERVKRLFPSAIRTAEDIPAPPGFIHTYDLTRLIISALKDVTLTGDVKKDRAALRHALERDHKPVQGLIKTYRQAFSPWTKTNSDAHEALDLDDFCMAQYDNADRVLVMPNALPVTGIHVK
ncbi:MAG: hypothetical protein COA42_20370 [Alteromonadaceae bacterium]|nr:MAG: hypothetical protein COA42_20370 [Alteromonadaceae bacterium]